MPKTTKIENGQTFVPRVLIMSDDEFNIRQDMGDLASLAADIAENGIRVPLEVRKGENDTYILVDGHRRLKASWMASTEEYGKKEIEWVPVQFEKEGAEPIDRLVSMFVRNTGKPLEPMEEQALFQRMLDLHFREKDIARKIGRSVEYVKGRLSLGRASDEVKRAVREKKITPAAAKALSKKPKAEQDKVVKAVREKSGSKKVKTRAVKAAAGIKSMRTEKEVRQKLKQLLPVPKNSRRITGWVHALKWVLGDG